MKGLIPEHRKRHFHSMGLHKPIAHLNVGIHQDFIVVDNICGDLDFEDGGNPVVMNRIWTAMDPVLVDAYVCQQLHYKVSDVPYVKLASELGVGCSDITKADIRVLGEDIQQNIPERRKVVEVADAVEEVDSCSACYGYLIPALDMLKQEGLLEKLHEKSVSARDIEERQANSASATAPETSNTTQKAVHQPKTRSTNS